MIADKIGVAVTTYRRPEVLRKALWGWAEHLHGVDELVVIHDRNGEGVSVSKNRSLAALMDLGCDHLFLADDDVIPICDDWWQPYLKAGQPALCHCWGKKRFLYVEGKVSVWGWPRGVLQFFERRVIERVGGMRTEFRNAGEHVDLFRRIHNAGFTTHPFMDAKAARDGVWWCADYQKTVPSSLPESRYSPEETASRHVLYDKYRHSSEYVEYR